MRRANGRPWLNQSLTVLQLDGVQPNDCVVFFSPTLYESNFSSKHWQRSLTLYLRPSPVKSYTRQFNLSCASKAACPSYVINCLWRHEHFSDAVCIANPLGRVYGLLQLRYLNRTPRWVDWICLGILIHCKVRTHPSHSLSEALEIWNLDGLSLRVAMTIHTNSRRCNLMDLAEPERNAGRQRVRR